MNNSRNKRRMLALVVAIGVVSLPGLAHAYGGALAPGFAVVESGFSLLLQVSKKVPVVTGKKPKPVPQSSGPHQMPELDPSSAASAVLLLLGGTIVMLGRRRSPSRPEADAPVTPLEG